MSVQVVSRGLPKSLSYIPDLLAAWFDSSAKRASWQRNTPENLSILWGKGMEPITKETIEENAPPEVKEACLGKKGKRGALFFNPDGHVQSHDCILCIQPVEEFDEQMDDIAYRRRMIEDGRGHIESLEDEMQRALAETGHSSGEPVLTGNIKRANQHVSVAKDLRSNVKIG